MPGFGDAIAAAFLDCRPMVAHVECASGAYSDRSGAGSRDAIRTESYGPRRLAAEQHVLDLQRLKSAKPRTTDQLRLRGTTCACV